jgi:hypothetical protein
MLDCLVEPTGEMEDPWIWPLVYSQSNTRSYVM